jgi:hypothetical protein
MARPLEVDWQDTPETLYSHYKEAKDTQDRTRLQALWRVRQGDGFQAAAERVFELLRERIEGRVYGSMPAKKEAVEAELEKLAADPEQVKSLTGWSWIHQAVVGLHAS